jgi:DNA polymerase-1
MELQQLFPLLHVRTRNTTKTTATIIKEINRQLEFIGNIPGGSALDYEWTKDGRQELIGLNVSLRDGTDWYLPTLAEGFSLLQYGEAIKRAVAGHCRSNDTVWHNAKADIQTQFPGDPLDYFGCDIHDTILMAYLVGEEELGLKTLTKKLLGRNAQSLPDKLETLPMEVAAKYGAEGDTRNTLDLFGILKRKLEDTNQWEIYNNLERPLVPVVASMEKYGSPVDMQEAVRLRNDYYEMELALEALAQVRGFSFRSDSGQKEYVTKHYGSNLGTLDKRVLSRIPGEWMDTLIGYRQIKTLRRNFLDKHIDKWRGLGEPTDYRLFPRFNQAGRDNENESWLRAPATGRFSSAGPNLQNQPRAIRSIFTAPAGHQLVSLDYSKLEMVVAAAVSGDPAMLAALRTGDIHAFMQEQIFNKTGVHVTRTTAKNGNFNLRYGGGPDMLMTISAKERAHLDYDVAKAIVDTDHATYTGYWQWYDSTVAEALRTGYSESLRGRRRYQDELFSGDAGVRQHAERAAANMVVQGTAADIIKEAMLKLIPILRYYKAHLSVQIHDELLFWVPEQAANAFRIAAAHAMESVTIPHLSLAVEGKIGKTWGDAH